MTIIFPFFAGDAPNLLNLLRWVQELGGCTGHNAVLVADESVSAETAMTAVSSCRKSFDETELITCPATQGWPQGPNALWLAAARHVKENKLGPWLFMEPDAVPLNGEWANQLALNYLITVTEYHLDKIQRVFLGHLYESTDSGTPPRMMSGVAVYPQNAYDWKEVITPGEAFDVSLSRMVMQYAAHTDLIHHVWGERGLPPVFVMSKTAQSPRHSFGLEQIKPQAVIFHRNKDGSLINLLRIKRGIVSDAVAIGKPRWEQDRADKKATPIEGGGGGMLGSAGRPVVVRRTAALGDVLAATCIAKSLQEHGHRVVFQAHASAHCILRRVPWVDRVEEPRGHCDIDLDGAYERNPHRRSMHFAQMFVEHANHGPIKLPPARNYAPRMILEPHELAQHYQVLKDWPKPWVMICPRSDSHANRTVPDHIWEEAAGKMIGTKFWIGRHKGPAGIVDLGCRHFDDVIRYLGLADIYAGVDSGPMHVAAALGVPVVTIEQASSPELHLSDQVDHVRIGAPLHCLNCQDTKCRLHNPDHPPCQNVSPDLIADAVNLRLQSIVGDGVSAVVAIWKPQASKLNRCLEAVLPQVDEVIVCVDAAGYVPRDMMQHPKVRLVKHPHGSIGYGRNANRGARHTNHKFMLMLNDDVYLEPGVVEHLKSLMADDVGIVGHLLRYLDGTIQHGGTYRNPGDKGWGHVDLRARETRYKEPLEMENVTGASILVRREAFYSCGAFDEDFSLYCEDNAFSLQMRRAGFKIIFTPLVCGTHEEHASSSMVQGIHQIMQDSQHLFERKWGWWFKKNEWTVPGTFD